MSPLTLLLVALAGALGAAARYGLDVYLTRRSGGRFPLGTLTVNVSGSLALGLLAGLALGGGAPEVLRVMLGVGFLGAYTTFSTWMVETLRLLQEGAWSLALLNAGMSAIAGALAAAAGLFLGLNL